MSTPTEPLWTPPSDKVLERDNYTCVYCGFDGRLFDNWMQLSWDHLLPTSQGGKDELENLATACLSCNSITSRMRISPGETREEILTKKREHVAQRRKEYYARWLDSVAKRYLDRPLPEIREAKPS